MKRTVITTSIVVAALGIMFIANKIDNEGHRQEEANIIKEINSQIEKENIIDIYFEDIKEINKNLVELTIFDSKYSTYKEKIQEEAWINPLETNIETKYKYKVALDINSININKSEYIEIDIPNESVYISDKIIEQPRLDTDTNLFNSFKGNKIEMLHNKAIETSYIAIDRLIEMDYSKRKNNILDNIKYKLSKVYDINEKYLKINIEGANKDE